MDGRKVINAVYFAGHVQLAEVTNIAGDVVGTAQAFAGA
jgi:hypothetical protein